VAYKGWITLSRYADKNSSVQFTHFQAKDASKEALTINTTAKIGNRTVPACEAEDKTVYYLYEYLSFENCIFHAKFKVGSPFSTAASCACLLTCDDFQANMYLDDLWKVLHKVTYDFSDPSLTTKYIEGDFTFIKKGQALALTPVL
jgi:hypothetical protein